MIVCRNLPTASCSGESNLPSTAERCNSLLHLAAGSQILPLHDAAGSQILPLHDAAGSHILLPHDATGSQFGSGESSQKTLEDSLRP
jgi:hypothetical protein